MIDVIREKVCNLNNIMVLPSKSSSGYAMVALLVAMSVMAVMLSVALPTWSHLVRREQEEELIFRGQQYARAINQYQRKYANQSPANLDVLIEQRFLRKKFKDPLSPNKDGEFQMLYFQTGTGPQGSGPQGPGGTSRGTGGIGTGGIGGTGSGPGSPPRGTGPGATGGPSGSIGPSPGLGGGRGGPIVGVVSKNTGQSIRLYNGKNRYNEWQFIGMELSSRAGGGGGGGAPGGRGGSGGRSGPAGRTGPDRGGDRGGRTTGPGGPTFPPPGGRSPMSPQGR
jgi:type II secretory pathway pseudopilin PulG